MSNIAGNLVSKMAKNIAKIGERPPDAEKPASESGRCTTVKARFWPWLSSESVLLVTSSLESGRAVSHGQILTLALQ